MNRHQLGEGAGPGEARLRLLPAYLRIPEAAKLTPTAPTRERHRDAFADATARHAGAHPRYSSGELMAGDVG